jgi:hypothetical protein
MCACHPVTPATHKYASRARSHKSGNYANPINDMVCAEGVISETHPMRIQWVQGRLALFWGAGSPSYRTL